MQQVFGNIFSTSFGNQSNHDGGDGGISFMDLFGGEELNVPMQEVKSSSSEQVMATKEKQNNIQNHPGIPNVQKNNGMNNSGGVGNESNKKIISNSQTAQKSEKKTPRLQQNIEQANLEKSNNSGNKNSTPSIADLLFGNVGSNTATISQTHSTAPKNDMTSQKSKSNPRKMQQTLEASRHSKSHSIQLETSSEDSDNETQNVKNSEKKKTNNGTQNSKILESNLKSSSTHLKSTSAPKSSTNVRKSSPSKEKGEPTVLLKRKFVQTLLDKSMFEKSSTREDENTNTSLFCMCCNQYIPISSTLKKPSKKVKVFHGTHIEWNEHLESDSHHDMKEVLKRFNVLCFESGTCKTRFHHFANAYCLMNFHKVFEFARNFHKNMKRKRVIHIHEDEDHVLDRIFIDYIANFVYRKDFVAALSIDREINSQDCVKCVKRFFNSMRQMALSVSYNIWRVYGTFFENQTNECFGEILSDLVHLGSEILSHLAKFGNFDPENLFLDEPFDCESLIPYYSNSEEEDDYEESSSEEELTEQQSNEQYLNGEHSRQNSSMISNAESDDSLHDRSHYYYHSHHPYFSFFIKLYIQHFFMFKPVKMIIPEAIEEFKHVIENTELSWEEWDHFIWSKKKQFLSTFSDKSESTIASDIQQDQEVLESATSHPSQSQQPVSSQKSIEELLFGSSSQTFENLFFMPSNSKPIQPKKQAQNSAEKRKTINPNSPENVVQNEKEMWALLLEEEETGNSVQ
ncbi:hypothetical protein C9374_009491 [Naegleria lovaniensis]|uniref:Uncharacterized protein n=1 Tax=Naegleria lovaniensis TaxID=51637 RepID=A0AA88H3E1_NAELO|nr:uncharacterized protein C9374_009491 [Naegleria lovaniensis]KAG2392914.1 hypothetical protein C9374_009491 [Naegleria lovaniensis]